MNRSVVVNLIANVEQWNRGLRNASATMQQVTSQNQDSVGKLSTQVGMLGAAVTGFAVLAVKKFADFDEAMSSVQSATKESAGNMSLLREAAIKAGASTVYSASEAAGAIEELGKAGVSTADILGGGLTGALNLAASEGMDVAAAAELTATALSQFGLAGNKASHVADLLAAGAGKAQGSAQDLGMALKQGGLVANQFGLSIEQTAGGLALFAQKGLIGSDAGTSLKSMLTALANPSKETVKQWGDITDAMYDANGQFIGLEAMAGVLRDQLGNLSDAQRQQALAQIFGTDAMRAASVLYDEGAEGVRAMTDAVNENGYAQDAAAIRLDNLKGDLEAMGGAWETLLIQMGEGGDAPLRTLVQGITGLLDKLNEIPNGVKTATLVFAGVGGLGMLGFAAISKISSGILSTTSTMAELGMISSTTAGKIQTGFGKGVAAAGKFAAALGLALAAAKLVGVAMGDLGEVKSVDAMTNAVLKAAEASQKAANSLQSIDTSGFLDEQFLTEGSRGWTAFADGISKVWNAVQWGEDVDLAGAVDGLQGLSDAANTLAAGEGGMSWFEDMMDTIGLVPSEVDSARESFANLDRSLAALVDAGKIDEAADGFANAQNALMNAGFSAEEVKGIFENYNISLDENKRATDEAAAAAEAEANSAEAQAEAHQQATDAIQEQLDALRDLTDANMSAASAEVGYQQSIADTTKKIAELRPKLAQNVDALDLTTQSGRDAQNALLNFAEAGLGTVDAMQTATDANGKFIYSGDEVRAKMQAVRDEFINNATQAGLTAEAAGRLADEWGLIPDRVTTAVEVDDQATHKIKNVVIELGKIKDKTVTIDFRKTGNIQEFMTGSRPGEGTVIKKAAGGSVVGPGTATSDSIPALLSNGEHVWTASDVEKAGGQDAVYRLRAAAQAGMLRFAGGGGVLTFGAPRNRTTDPSYWQRAFMPYLERLKLLTSIGEDEDRLRETGDKAITGARRRILELEIENDKEKLREAEWAANQGDQKYWDKKAAAAQDAARAKEQKAQEEERRVAAVAGYKEKVSTDLDRGNLTDSLTKGMSGVYSVTDQARGYLDNLTGSAKTGLAAAITEAEKAAKGLYDELAGVDEKLKDATDKVNELQQIKKGVANSVMGGFALGDVTQTSYVDPFTGKATGGSATTGQSMLAGAQAYAAKAKAFAGKIQALQGKGFAGKILQEIAGMGVEAGSVAADALLSLSDVDVTAMNTAYQDIEKWAGEAGEAVTGGFYEGGLKAAEGVVDGLEASKGDIEDAIMDMAINMQNALKKALGIQSPSRKFRDMMRFVGQGVSLGLEDQEGIISDASARMFDNVRIPTGSAQAAYSPVVNVNPSLEGVSRDNLDYLASRIVGGFETGMSRRLSDYSKRLDAQRLQTYGTR